MLILHPFSRMRMAEQVETFEALAEIRKHYLVKDIFCKDNQDYDQALKQVWLEHGDLIVVEQDIVPSVEMVQSLLDCLEPWCAYEYWVKYMDDKDLPFIVRTGLGLTKFTEYSRAISSPDKWFGKGSHFNLDCRVVDPLIQIGLRPHVHGIVKHNRLVDWRGE